MQLAVTTIYNKNLHNNLKNCMKFNNSQFLLYHINFTINVDK